MEGVQTMDPEFLADLRCALSPTRGPFVMRRRNTVFDNVEAVRFRHETAVAGMERPNLAVRAHGTEEELVEVSNLARLLGVRRVEFGSGAVNGVVPVFRDRQESASDVLAAAVTGRVPPPQVFDAVRISERVAMRNATFGEESWLAARFSTVNMPVAEVKTLVNPYECGLVCSLGQFLCGHDATFWDDVDKRDAALFILGLAQYRGVTYYLEHVVGAASRQWVVDLEARVRYGLRQLDHDESEFLGPRAACATPEIVTPPVAVLVDRVDRCLEQLAQARSTLDNEPVGRRVFHVFTHWLTDEIRLVSGEVVSNVERIVEHAKMARECMATCRLGKEMLEGAVHAQVWLTAASSLDFLTRKARTHDCGADEVVVVGTEMAKVYSAWLSKHQGTKPRFKRTFFVIFDEHIDTEMLALLRSFERHTQLNDYGDAVFFTSGGVLLLASAIGAFGGSEYHRKHVYLLGLVSNDRARVEVRTYPVQRVFFTFDRFPFFEVDVVKNQVVVSSDEEWGERGRMLWEVMNMLHPVGVNHPKHVINGPGQMSMVLEKIRDEASFGCVKSTWAQEIRERECRRDVWETGDDVGRCARMRPYIDDFD